MRCSWLRPHSSHVCVIWLSLELRWCWCCRTLPMKMFSIIGTKSWRCVYKWYEPFVKLQQIVPAQLFAFVHLVA